MMTILRASVAPASIVVRTRSPVLRSAPLAATAFFNVVSSGATFCTSVAEVILKVTAGGSTPSGFTSNSVPSAFTLFTVPTKDLPCCACAAAAVKSAMKKIPRIQLD